MAWSLCNFFVGTQDRALWEDNCYLSVALADSTKENRGWPHHLDKFQGVDGSNLKATPSCLPQNLHKTDFGGGWVEVIFLDGGLDASP